MPETVHSYNRQGIDALNGPISLDLLIKNVSAPLRLAINQRVTPLGLTAIQWHPLVMSRYHDASIPAEVARLMNIGTVGMPYTLGCLKIKGFPLHQRCDQDRRLVVLGLPPKNREVFCKTLRCKTLRKIVRSLNKHLDEFSVAEIDILRSLSHQVTEQWPQGNQRQDRTRLIFSTNYRLEGTH